MNWLLVIALILFMAYLEGVSAETEQKGIHFATLVAHCLNGGSLTDGEQTIDCKRRKP